MKKCGEQADQYMVIFLKKCAKQVIERTEPSAYLFVRNI